MIRMETSGGYSAEEAEAINDMGAASYDSESYLTQTDIPRFIALADLHFVDRVQDLGCGNAIMTIAAKLRRLVSLDTWNCSRATSKTISALAASSVWDGFDVILCRRVLCNLQDHQVLFLRHIASFLAPGGRTVTDQTYPYQFIATAHGTGVPGEKPPPCIKLGIEADWKKIEEQFREQTQTAGLTVDTVRNMDSVDGIDCSAKVFTEAQNLWNCSGGKGPMPDTFHELAKMDYLAATQEGEGHLEYATILCRLSRAYAKHGKE